MDDIGKAYSLVNAAVLYGKRNDLFARLAVLEECKKLDPGRSTGGIGNPAAGPATLSDLIS